MHVGNPLQQGDDKKMKEESKAAPVEQPTHLEQQPDQIGQPAQIEQDPQINQASLIQIKQQEQPAGSELVVQIVTGEKKGEAQL